MSFRPDNVQPPRIAVWLITLFTPAVDAESMEGDLLEEFSRIASEASITCARRWYWRRAIKTIPHLVAAEFRTAPWTIAAVVTGAFLLRWYVSASSNASVSGALNTALRSYQVAEYDPQAYMFWMTSGMVTVRVTLNALVGLLVAVVAKGREMAATVTLALLSIVLAVHATLLTVASTGDYGVVSTLSHTFAFSAAIVVAGAAVRTYRSRATTRRAIV